MLQLVDHSSVFDEPRLATVEAHLLAQVDYLDFVVLQQRLHFDTASRADGQITMLLCEHPPIITIGRAGSEADVEPRGVLLAGQNVDVISEARGGGTMLLAPGQLSVYPIVPLDWHGWSVGEYMLRFQAGLLDALKRLGIAGTMRPGRHGIWGKSGQLVSFGIQVRDSIAFYGAQLQVAPPLPLAKFIVTDPVDQTPLGSVSRERKRSTRMSTVRSRVVRSVADAFGCEKYHLYTGHPLLPEIHRTRREAVYAS